MKATRTAIVRQKQQQKAFDKNVIVGRKKSCCECFKGSFEAPPITFIIRGEDDSKATEEFFKNARCTLVKPFN